MQKTSNFILKKVFFVILVPQAKVLGIRKVKRLKKDFKKVKDSQNKVTKSTDTFNWENFLINFFLWDTPLSQKTLF